MCFDFFIIVIVLHHYTTISYAKTIHSRSTEFLAGTQIVEKGYDDILKEWIGDSSWKLIYRASEHEYSAESFHQYCDGQRPTLIVIKSNGGWIFGGYTTQSWSGDGIYYDML